MENELLSLQTQIFFWSFLLLSIGLGVYGATTWFIDLKRKIRKSDPVVPPFLWFTIMLALAVLCSPMPKASWLATK